MIGTKILFYIICMNVCGTHGADEGDNENNFFGGLWRKAFATNLSTNLEQLNSDQKHFGKKERLIGVKAEQDEDDNDQTISAKIKIDPISDKQEGKATDEKKCQKIKKEPKMEANNFDDLMVDKSYMDCVDQRPNDALSAQNESEQSADGTKIERTKKEHSVKMSLIKKFDKMRKEYKLKNGYKNQDRYKMEKQIVTELGVTRYAISKWKKEMCRKEHINTETKLKMIKKFEQIKNKYKRDGEYKNENRASIETEIARHVGTHRLRIYQWKRELGQPHKQEMGKRNSKLVTKFDKMRNEYKMSNNYKLENRHELDNEIAKKLGTYRTKIDNIRRRQNQNRKREMEERKCEIVKQFDTLKKEYRIGNGYKNEKRAKIETEIANKLGTFRNKIYEWKKELCIYPSKKYRTEKKSAIIEHFDKLTTEFSNKFNVKINNEIKGKIARKFGICRRTISKWRRELSNKLQK